MVIVVCDCPTESVVSCTRIVGGAVGAFCGKPPFEGFTHRFSQERPGDGVRRRDGARVERVDAWRGPVTGGEDAELLVGV